MPIRPENKDRYPAEWDQIRARIQQRAGNRCEVCGVKNHAWGWRAQHGEFREISGYTKHLIIEEIRRESSRRRWIEPPFVWSGHKVIKIVCTTAHLDHVPEHCKDDNLKFMCQRCHLAYDAEHHAQTRYMSRRQGRAVADLFIEVDA